MQPSELYLILLFSPSILLLIPFLLPCPQSILPLQLPQVEVVALQDLSGLQGGAADCLVGLPALPLLRVDQLTALLSQQPQLHPVLTLGVVLPTHPMIMLRCRQDVILTRS